MINTGGQGYTKPLVRSGFFRCFYFLKRLIFLLYLVETLDSEAEIFETNVPSPPLAFCSVRSMYALQYVCVG